MSREGTSRLVILTGASGAGKTTLAKAIAAQYLGKIEVLFFDSIGVPPVEEMTAKFGSPEAWQRAKTIDWMKKVAIIIGRGSSVVFEGQMRISFVEEALALADIHSARIILVDCNDAARAQRLNMERAQPHLADATMMNWARFLRDEATRGGYERLDTSRLDVGMCVNRICQRFTH